MQDELRNGRLVELLPGLRPLPMPISVVAPTGRLMPARVRAAMEALAAMGRRRTG